MNKDIEDLNLSEGYKIYFDKNTINHLGIQLYSSFPPILGELISNSYDAEAENLDINIFNLQRRIEIIDDGHGMDYNDLNKEYLVIGRNRRKEKGDGFSKNRKRKVTGKKGLGKLAAFGVAHVMKVISVKDGLKNGFEINYNDLINIDGSYKPSSLFENEVTGEKNGTKIIIEQIKENKRMNFDDIKIELSKRFNFFDKNFNVKLHDKNNEESTLIDKNIYYDSLDTQFTWKFPEDFPKEIEEIVSYKNLKEKNISGVIYTNKTPLQKKSQGFNIYVRRKFASGNTHFDDRANDRFNEYAFGYFNIDFIDEDNEKDFISTARQSILWESDDELIQIRKDLKTLVSKIGRDWRKKRNDLKEQELDIKIIEEDPDLFKDMNEKDKDSLLKIKQTLSKNADIDHDANSILDVLRTIKNQFKFETFKQFVISMNDSLITLENMEKIANDWEYIEAKELAQISVGRIEAIKIFQRFIDENHSETKVIQPFLEKFPWLLDSRITSFEREVTFKQILKKNYPDEDLEQSNRRIDFLCNAVGDSLFIVELKRPNIKISQKEILQTMYYNSFILEKYADRFQNVETFLISENVRMDNETRALYDVFRKDKKLIIKTYSSMIQQAKEYHKHFIEAYDKIQTLKNLN